MKKLKDPINITIIVMIVGIVICFVGIASEKEALMWMGIDIALVGLFGPTVVLIIKDWFHQQL